jgi:uncharacterized tellurite resistance protein B-like protein
MNEERMQKSIAELEAQLAHRHILGKSYEVSAQSINKLAGELEAARMKANELGAEVSRLRNELADQNHYAHKLELRLAKEHNYALETHARFEELIEKISDLESALKLARPFDD